ncbi:MAG: hypothetical protein ACPL3B_06215 [Fervidobacterium sp.]
MCQKQKSPVAVYLPNLSKEDAIEFINYCIDKSFLSELTENVYLKNFFKAFYEIDGVEDV